MITIENLDVAFDAEHERDESVFASLFARYIARHEEQRARDTESAALTDAERSVEGGDGW